MKIGIGTHTKVKRIKSANMFKKMSHIKTNFENNKLDFAIHKLANVEKTEMLACVYYCLLD